MGSKFSKKGFCATYAKHKKQKAEEATAKASETPSTAQTSLEALAWIENQYPTQTMEVSEQDHDEQAQTTTRITKGIGEAQPAVGALQQTEAPNTEKSREENGRAQPTAQVTEEMEAKPTGKGTLQYPAELQPTAGAVREAENQPAPETTGEAEVLSAGEAETIEQVTEDPQNTEVHTAAETTQDIREVVAEDRLPDAWLMEGMDEAPLAVVFLQEKGVQNAAQATEETEAARDSETQPLAEMSEGPTGKTEPQLAAQITTENETCPTAEYMRDTDGAQPVAQTGQLIVRSQFAQTMEETGSQANIQTAQETVLSLASAETKQVTPENAVQSILQDTSMVSRVCRVPEENVLQSMNHSSDSTMQERQPTVWMTQKIETLYGEKMTELKNVQCQQNVKHPRVPSALTGNKAKEDVSTPTAGTDAPVNPVLGRQEVDSQVLEASVPEMHKSRGEEETANPWTLSAPETQGSEREVVPASIPRSSNNEAALDSGESQTTEATDSLCVCSSYSPSRRANFICCCSN